ncbi:MOSC domain-containing protein [Actinacidiphila rubida]|uniref:MOSC domain-containing protein YiiM n=1 Tax=Actinacidiphila rubida TaxID=310780 RepID=A0A1H8MJP3_9ACTN|nr:MOSC domain-containing protein [Actinacidiphila rubida]SEO17503.1 MOSC domain-containing protein YiiM [Actinacidiphila rubida]
MPHVLSVNVSRPMAVPYTDSAGGVTGIDKRPADGPVRVAAPGPRGSAGGGLAGDTVCDLRFHGGDDQAVYAYAREDLDHWERELGRPLMPGMFGENLTTTGIDVNAALVGERWRIGEHLVLEVTSGRIPCRTFAGRLDEKGWVKRFTQAVRPGPFFRVVVPGPVAPGDPVTVLSRPDHEVTVAFLFRAMTTEPALLPRVLAARDTLNTSYLTSVQDRLSRGVAR